MKSIFLLLLILVVMPFGGQTQTLVSSVKKKYLGKYEGVIPSYTVSADTSQYEVEKVAISIDLTSKEVLKRVGRLEQHGTYKILFKDKSYYVIELHFPAFALTEKWMLKEKSKELIREGGLNLPAVRLKYKGK